MRRIRALYAAAVIGLALPVSGCGGAKNPIHTNVHVPKFVSGLWDGFMAIIAFFFHLANPHKYAFYGSHLGHYWTYWLGYALGLMVFLGVVSALIAGYRRRRTVRVTRTY
jgi:energy-coupling factor transporter transmembrane protein EcfT